MIISWYGEGCFKIQQGDLIMLTDLPAKGVGIQIPRLNSDILIKTITKWPIKENNEKSDFVIYGAGEYDIKGIKIRGFSIDNESNNNFFKTIYSILWDDISIVLFGAIESAPSPDVLTFFEDIDIVIGPGGGAPFIKQDKMYKLLKQLNPKVFIPSFYKIKGLKRKSDSIDVIKKEFNGQVIENKDKFVFKKKDLYQIKKTNLVILNV